MDLFQLEVSKVQLLFLDCCTNVPRWLISPLNSSLYSTTPRRYGVCGSTELGFLLTFNFSRDDGQGATDGRIDIRRDTKAVQQTFVRVAYVVVFYKLTGDLEVGDYVERDEEIATIETDKARHSTTRFCSHR